MFSIGMVHAQTKLGAMKKEKTQIKEKRFAGNLRLIHPLGLKFSAF
jgi:hypothetical protein